MVARVSSVKEYFDTLQDRFIADKAKGVSAVVVYDLTGDNGGTWTVTIDDGTLSVAEGGVEKPKVTFKMVASDYVDMVNGDLDGRRAFMTRKLKIAGSIPTAKKMETFLPPRPKSK